MDRDVQMYCETQNPIHISTLLPHAFGYFGLDFFPSMGGHVESMWQLFLLADL